MWNWRVLMWEKAGMEFPALTWLATDKTLGNEICLYNFLSQLRQLLCVGKIKWYPNLHTVNQNGIFDSEMFSGEFLLRNRIFACHWTSCIKDFNTVWKGHNQRPQREISWILKMAAILDIRIFFYEFCIINIEKWIDLKNDRCKYVRILQYLRK